MSKFTVSVFVRQKKFLNPLQLDESYTDWATADKAFCAYRALIDIEGSNILNVELIEHREETVHKAASKETHSNVVTLEKANGTHG